MINLTCLAPDIMAATLDDTLPDHVTLFDLAVDPPRLWEAQRRLLEISRWLVSTPSSRSWQPTVGYLNFPLIRTGRTLRLPLWHLMTDLILH